MTKSTIQELLNSRAYILENPSTGLLHIGPLSENDSEPCSGRFVSYDEKRDFLLDESLYHLTRKELNQELQSIKFEISNSQKNLEVSSSKDYKEAFSEAQKAFTQSDLRKVVLYREAKAQMTNSLGIFFKSLSALSRSSHQGYLYGLIDNPKNFFLLGLSPEFLFKQIENRFLTTAVAGTGNLDDDLKKDPKLIEEHRLVEEGINESLGRDLDWAQSKEVAHAKIKHLVSEGIIGADIDPKSLSRSLHPTSAVGSLPKNTELNFSPGPEPRSFYGGYADLFSDSAFSLVLIRGMEIEDDTLSLKFGGGVIKESVLENELNELEIKLQNMKGFLNL